MRLLLITQVVDRNDSVLGFMHGWIEKLAEHFEHISVICLKKGDFRLPNNVEVFSLGKEEGTSRVMRIIRFFRYIFVLRSSTDGVFVHMNPEYVVLGGMFWRLWEKRIVLWYNHGQRNLRLRLAMMLSNVVCYTSPYSASAGNAKSRQMPVGVDTKRFVYSHFSPRVHEGHREVLYLGRIAPVKRVDVIVEAVRRLLDAGVYMTLSVVGEALLKDSAYMGSLRRMERTGIAFRGAESDRDKVIAVLNSNEFLINASPPGMYDKVVFEAMACECIPLVSSKAFEGILPPECFFKEGDSGDLARVIQEMFSRPTGELESLCTLLRKRVTDEHSLERLVGMIANLYV